MNIDQNLPYHSINIQETLEKVSGKKNGLTSEEIKQRQEQFGKNKLPEKGGINPLLLFLKQFKDFLILILFIAAGIAFWAEQMADVYIILAVILFNAIMGFTQEYKAEKAIESIKKMEQRFAYVLRDGKEQEIEVEDVVPGDIMILKEGKTIPADGRLLEAKELRTAEASLTGESLPIDKQTDPVEENAPLGDRKNMAWKSTNVVNGKGKAVVTAIGNNTEIGKIAKSMGEMEMRDSNFRKKTKLLGKQMAVIAIITSLIIFVLGFWVRDFEFQEILLVTIAVLVSTIPEGLPAVISIVLAIGANRMAKQNVIIREFTATEMMGSVSTILVDKTGTLTQSILVIKKIFTGSGKETGVTGRGHQLEGQFKENGGELDLDKNPVEKKLLVIAAFCNDARLKGEEEEEEKEKPSKQADSEKNNQDEKNNVEEKQDEKKGVEEKEQDEENTEEKGAVRQKDQKQNDQKEEVKEKEPKAGDISAQVPQEDKERKEEQTEKDKKREAEVGEDEDSEKTEKSTSSMKESENKTQQDIDVDMDIESDKIKINVNIKSKDQGTTEEKEGESGSEDEGRSVQEKSEKTKPEERESEQDKDMDVDLDVEPDKLKTKINIKSDTKKPKKKDGEEPDIEEEEEEEEEQEEEENENNDKSDNKEDQGPQVAGDPTEAAMYVVGKKAKIKEKDPFKQYKLLDDLPFKSEQKFRASLVKTEDGAEIFVIGAPERILELSSSYLTPEGPKELDDEKREELEEKMGEWADQAMRVLALGFKKSENKDKLSSDDVNDIIWVGITGIIDPPRKGVPESIEECKKAGIRVIMVTGDHKKTAAAIARDVGILSGEKKEDEDHPLSMTTKELDVGDEEFDRHINNVNVFARMNPDTKLRIAERLQAADTLIAMTGDGVNDAPALKRADVGIAMGQRGTDVAKDASDIVLQDDNFSSIVNAIREGRIVFNNVKITSYFLLTTNFAFAIGFIFGMSIGWPLLLTAAQILYVNLITDGIMDVALATEPGHGGIMNQPPVKKSERILKWDITPYLLLVSAVMVTLTLLGFNYYLPQGEEMARTGAFIIVSTTQLFNAYNMRSLRQSIFEIGIFSNRWVNLAFIAAIIFQIVVIKVPTFRDFMELENLPFIDIFIMILISSIILGTGELYKYLRFKKELI